MYYIIYTGATREISVERDIKDKIPGELYRRIFHPVRRRKKKYHGEWKTVTEKLVPGYVFIETDHIGEFYQELRRRHMVPRILGKEYTDTADISFYEMKPEEELWLTQLTAGSAELDADGNTVLGLSEIGFGENDEVIVLSGPLQNLSGYVRRINLHKRIAEVTVDFMGAAATMYLGIDIMARKDELEGGER
ncbi:MAG: hypothetical protein IJS22_01170 [Lachnospiraceae bacterium]|nr:hypothetical protein [Lachnospiraceae bacterium]